MIQRISLMLTAEFDVCASTIHRMPRFLLTRLRLLGWPVERDDGIDALAQRENARHQTLAFSRVHL